jgi:hypothetical protein
MADQTGRAIRGQVANGPNGAVFDTNDLKLLSTYHLPQVAQFAAFHATIAAYQYILYYA